MNYDVAVIGAGVTGAFIARELSRYDLRIALLEKCNDLAMGTSKANSGIIHSGFDAVPGTLKAKLNVKGTALMPQVSKELSAPFKQIGSLVVAYTDEETATLEALRERGEKNGVPGLEIYDREKLLEIEPMLNEEAKAALWAPTAGIACPYELTIAAAENAVENGTEFIRNFCVDGIDYDGAVFTVKCADKSITAKYVVNAAGVFCDEIAAMIGDNSLKTIARKGEYMLCDKTAGGTVKHTIFQCPNPMGKGVLVTPTVDGNLLIGPSSIDIEDIENTDTTASTLEAILATAKKSVPSLTTRDVITSFAGLRAHLECDDFIIEKSKGNDKFINVAGIESPGLSSAPAVGLYVADMIVSDCKAAEKPGFNPVRKPPV
ncbi:MAG: NAD(P)/FAD-dependent oxidoreductase, partial [Clostridia bacterium]|nr:NAD(P)/FAD-dependent oxidoreductase [Clostridia bacterium]